MSYLYSTWYCRFLFGRSEFYKGEEREKGKEWKVKKIEVMRAIVTCKRYDDVSLIDNFTKTSSQEIINYDHVK